ncbi:hypothetical protein BLNAU_3254 [Blattamonas nauphoetae]|uniref:Uncharacterized protein n=1 Tax=Blattamonas nauphoetae TaxID=2049346 RepID=A0ABQ9YDI0_9EUKA|nr:hypothetical protein BLNAU_3254 [Blattamonas nauphoetae]
MLAKMLTEQGRPLLVLVAQDSRHVPVISPVTSTHYSEYSPFLKWNPVHADSPDSVAQPFVSLASMRVFIFKPPTLVSSKLIPRMLSTPHLRDLSLIADSNIMLHILTIFYLAGQHQLYSLPLHAVLFIDPQSTRNLVLHEVLIPLESSLVQIRRNPRLLSWKEKFKAILEFLVKIFDVSAFHQPTLNFTCSSRIPTVFQSLLLEVEHEETYQFIIWLMSDYLRKWKRDGAETAGRGRIVLQTLEQEGFFEGLEQTLHPDKSTMDGLDVRTHSLWLMKRLGTNSGDPSTDAIAHMLEIVRTSIQITQEQLRRT